MVRRIKKQIRHNGLVKLSMLLSDAATALTSPFLVKVELNLNVAKRFTERFSPESCATTEAIGGEKIMQKLEVIFDRLDRVDETLKSKTKVELSGIREPIGPWPEASCDACIAPQESVCYYQPTNIMYDI